MKKFKRIVPLLFIVYTSVFGQKYSLKQCIDYAKQNNSNIKMAYLDAQVSDKAVDEQIGRSLPQVDISGSMDDKLNITTQLLPGELMGKPGVFIPVKMGTKYNASAGITLTQKVFDPSIWVALKAAKLSQELSNQTIQKTDEQTTYNVGSAYYRAMVIKKQLENLKVILSVSQKNLDATEQKFQNGLSKKIDVDKIKVTFNNTNSQVQQLELSYKQALNNLKFYMGMPVESSIDLPDELSDNLITTVEEQSSQNYIENRIDYQIQKSSLALYEADRENNIAAYYPSLSFSANYSYQAMRQQFDIFNFQKSWYNSASIGLQISIPVFSGFKRYAKVEQSGLNVLKAQENLKLTEQSIKVELSNY
jgi:outer membrane protein TolC